MSCLIKLGFCLLCLVILENSSGWSTYRVDYLSAKVYGFDPEYVIASLEVKKLNRTYSYLNFRSRTTVRIDEGYVRIVLYQFLSNRYHQSFMNKTFDACALMDKKRRPPYSGLIMDVLQEKGFPRKCPVPAGDVNLTYIHFDEEKFPTFLAPPGRWKGALFLYTDNKEIGSGEVVIEIKEYISKKQLG